MISIAGVSLLFAISLLGVNSDLNIIKLPMDCGEDDEGTLILLDDLFVEYKNGDLNVLDGELHILSDIEGPLTARATVTEYQQGKDIGSYVVSEDDNGDLCQKLSGSDEPYSHILETIGSNNYYACPIAAGAYNLTGLTFNQAKLGSLTNDRNYTVELEIYSGGLRGCILLEASGYNGKKGDTSAAGAQNAGSHAG